MVSIKKKIIEKYANHKSQQIINSFYKTNLLNPSNNIIITGSPRSGTTWLAEIIEKNNDGIMLFEPLSLSGVPAFKKLGFDWRQHIPEDIEWNEAIDIFRKIYNGKYLTPWMLSHSDKNKLTSADFFILKFVRANLLLPWLIKHLTPQKKPIYIVRNPLSVLASQLELDWKHAPKNFKIPKGNFLEKFYEPYINIIQNVNTTEGHLISRWCIENQYLLNHQKNNIDWIFTTYENLVKKSEEEFNSIFKRLELEINPNINLYLNKLSKSSYLNKSEGSDHKEKLSEWKKKLSKKQIDNSYKLISDFGMEKIFIEYFND